MQKNPLGERRGASGGNWFPPGRRGAEGMDIPQNVPAPWPPYWKYPPGGAKLGSISVGILRAGGSNRGTV